jgi:hypothetical protein
MSKSRAMSISLAVAALGLAATASAHAQGRSAVTPAELEAAVAARPAGNREAVQDFLANPQVQSVANRMGVSTSELSAGVASLDQAALDRIAQETGVGDRAGGAAGTVVISTTVIIIALLIIILLTK